MSVVAEPLANGRALVYLDQADWSYLADGKATDAEAVLRRLGEHDVTYLLSPEHFYETAGLGPGLSRRVAYLESFPGAVLFPVGSTALLQLNMLQLVRIGSGESPERQTIEAQPLTGPMEEAVRSLQVAIPAFRMGEIAMRLGRATRRGQDKEEMLTRNHMRAALLRGDWKKHLVLRERLGESPTRRERIMTRAIAPVLGWLGERLERAGWRPLYKKGEDPVFEAVYVRFWPPGLPRNRANIRAAHKAWRQRDKYLRAIPSLLAFAAVYENLHYRQDTFNASDFMDPLHAAYAPLCDLFTGDKRTIEPLDRMFEQAGTVFCETERLADVARGLEAGIAAMRESGEE